MSDLFLSYDITILTVKNKGHITRLPGVKKDNSCYTSNYLLQTGLNRSLAIFIVVKIIIDVNNN